MKISQLGVEFCANRHTERYDEAKIRFANAPKKRNVIYVFSLKPYCIVFVGRIAQSV